MRQLAERAAEKDIGISPRVAGRLSESLTANYLEQWEILPLEVTDGTLIVTTWSDAPDRATLDELAYHFSADIRVVRHSEDEIRRAIRRLYAQEHAAEVQRGTDLQDGSPNDVRLRANDAPVVSYVNSLLMDALSARASDIHYESRAAAADVRYRVDGLLVDAPPPPPELAHAVASRLKIIAELDINERRLPQDGRARLRIGEEHVDVRLSVMPKLNGESIVLRLLQVNVRHLQLHELGLPPHCLSAVTKALLRPHGMILVTGPTGSGKTTTLYAALRARKTNAQKIMTIEDPVEYEVPGVSQVPVNTKTGLTFARALRSFLRQDPDVLLVGEIRDQETAEICARAALTGHLLLSTLHTNDAPTALVRLLELGIPPYLIVNTVELIIAQRLLRTCCIDCRVSKSDLTGCRRCGGTGYNGRRAVFEVLPVSADLREALAAGSTGTELRRAADAARISSLAEEGHRLVAEGITTETELKRIMSDG